MTSSTSDIPSFLQFEHRGWKLDVQWLASVSTSAGGWVCYATRPDAAQGLNVGRWGTSELAAEHGRAHVDRQMDSPSVFSRKPHVPRRRQ